MKLLWSTTADRVQSSWPKQKSWQTQMWLKFCFISEAKSQWLGGHQRAEKTHTSHNTSLVFPEPSLPNYSTENSSQCVISSAPGAPPFASPWPGLQFPTSSPAEQTEQTGWQWHVRSCEALAAKCQTAAKFNIRTLYTVFLTRRKRSHFLWQHRAKVQECFEQNNWNSWISTRGGCDICMFVLYMMHVHDFGLRIRIVINTKFPVLKQKAKFALKKKDVRSSQTSFTPPLHSLLKLDFIAVSPQLL